MEEIKNALGKINSALNIERKIVGVKFLFTKEEYDHCNAPIAKAKMAYCVMVKTATRGVCLKADLSLFGCGGGTRALGLEQPTEEFKSGCEYNSFGLYKNLAIAKNVVNNITFCKHKAYGVLIKPMEEFKDEKPDVAIIITTPYNCMRIVQGYTYKFGTQTNFKLTGNQAVCAECTAYPFETNSINISMFCSGTRYLAGWGQDELGIGLPYDKFIDTCEGVYKTINGTEQNKRKTEIIDNLNKCGIENPGIYDDDAYFIRYERSSK